METTFIVAWNDTDWLEVFNVTNLSKRQMWTSLNSDNRANIFLPLRDAWLYTRMSKGFQAYSVTVTDITEVEFRDLIKTDIIQSKYLIRQNGFLIYLYNEISNYTTSDNLASTIGRM